MSPRVRALKLMTSNTIEEEYGLAKSQARSLGRYVAREYGVVRIPGQPRRVYYRREDVERVMKEAGATKWY